jgi:hypothetical protein
MCTTGSSRLNKKDIERRIDEKDASISFAKPKDSNHMSKHWSEFSQIYVFNIKQDFIICDFCKSVLVYKSTTGSGCMQVHARSCESKREELNSSHHQQKINHYYKSKPNERKKVPKQFKDSITSSYVEFVVQDGRAFRLAQGSGFIRLAKKLYDTGRFMSSSADIDIEELLPDPTTVSNFYSKNEINISTIF